MNLELIIQGEGRQKKKNKYRIFNACIWNLRSCLQGKTRNAAVDNGLVDTAGEGQGERNGASGTDVYTLPCIKQVASGKLLYNTGSLCKAIILQLQINKYIKKILTVY